MQSAQKAISSDKAGSYYRDLLAEMVKQHATLLESENKIDEAQQIRAQFGQSQ